MMTKSIENESYYDKYFIYIWCGLGFILSASQTLTPAAIEKAGLFLSLFVSVVLTIPVTFFLYVIYIFSSFIISLFINGIKEKHLISIFGAIYFLFGLILYIMDTLSNV